MLMFDLSITAGIPYDSLNDWSVGPLWCGEATPKTSLNSNAGVWMTDLPVEIETHREAVEQAAQRGGKVLVTGLGLAIVARLCLRLPNVERVTVVELNREPIELVGRHWQKIHGDRLEIIQADAWTWTPPAGAKYTVAWHDAWLFGPNERLENFAEARQIMEHYADYCDWQGWWKGH